MINCIYIYVSNGVVTSPSAHLNKDQQEALVNFFHYYSGENVVALIKLLPTHKIYIKDAWIMDKPKSIPLLRNFYETQYMDGVQRFIELDGVPAELSFILQYNPVEDRYSLAGPTGLVSIGIKRSLKTYASCYATMKISGLLMDDKFYITEAFYDKTSFFSILDCNNLRQSSRNPIWVSLSRKDMEELMTWAIVEDNTVKRYIDLYNVR